MTKSCCYPGCSSDTKSGIRSLFSFPVRDPTRRSQWIAILGCSQADAASRTRGVCDLHFESKYIVSYQRRRTLIGMALPYRLSVAAVVDDHKTETDDNSFEFHCLDDEVDDDDPFDEAEDEMHVEHQMYEEVDFVDDADNVKDESGETITSAVDYLSGDSMEPDKHGDELLFNVIKTQLVDTMLSDNDLQQAMDASVTTTTKPPQTQQLMGSFATNITEGVSSSAHSYAPSDKEPLASITIHKDVKLQRVIPRPQQPLPEPSTSFSDSIEEHPDVLKTTSQTNTRSPTTKRQRIESEPELQVNSKDVPIDMPAPSKSTSTPCEPTPTTDQHSIRALPTQAKLVSVRGVEHVQMPLYVYEAEQKMMRDELLYWKNIVLGFKAKLDDVEF